jgi:N-acetylmuramoyl-L-alanine amidase
MALFDLFKRKPVVIPAADAPKPKKKPTVEDFTARLPPTRAQRLIKLGLIYADEAIDFPHLKDITFAQWCIESTWGNSRVAREEWNFAGMKWRDGDRKYGGEPSKKSAFDGYEHNVRYTHFPKMGQFIRAYWGRLDEVSAYKGWRAHTEGAVDFIAFIGPTWVGYNQDQYVEDVIRVWKKYTRGLF